MFHVSLCSLGTAAALVGDMHIRLSCATDRRFVVITLIGYRKAVHTLLLASLCSLQRISWRMRLFRDIATSYQIYHHTIDHTVCDGAALSLEIILIY